MKIGFYLQNKGIIDIDCSEPLKGNPGIGGTEYLFIAIPYAIIDNLKVDKTDKRHEIIVITDVKGILPENIPQVIVEKSLNETIIKENIDLLVIRYSWDNYNLVRTLSPKVKVVVWAHNFVKRTELTALAKDTQIVTIVCVGSEQLNLYRDHAAFNKSVIIYNGYPIKHFISYNSSNVRDFHNRRNEVTYLGSLVNFKGFHLLAKAWKTVVRNVPDAHLNVIGGAKLYNRNQKLGKWNIAEESYENEFMPYLLDEDGNLLPSVTFHGVMGNEKTEILNNTKVGVPNPSGVSETFCIAALELQLWGAVIATIDFGGFKDTVFSTGILYKDVSELADAIIKQLRKKNNYYSELLNHLQKFDFSEVASKWLTLFDGIEQNKPITFIRRYPIVEPYSATELNRKIKSILPFGSFLPTIMFYSSVSHRIKSIFKKS